MVSTNMPPYRVSLAGLLLAAREAVMAPIRPCLRDAGVTDQQWRVLRALSDEGALDLGSLAAHALLHPPSATRIIKDMADRGLIQRAVDPANKRRIILQLTEAGEDLVHDASPQIIDVLDSYAADLGTARLAALRRELQALIDIIGKAEARRN